MLYLIVYLLFCLLVAYAGRYKRFGLFGNFFIALLLSPLVGIVAVLVQTEKDRIKSPDYETNR
ncbi:MAG: hypothetical protein MI864_09070 [Pseudomonadales bacterium]|uniref:Uncharacterized protein n=1 Tax=Oleiphilus messinensis TaxID=141451 RepID=A0A1Y0I8A3_9GAMM|nr:hypothetical protein [Oleiphilus messinensis]ARU56732.1 hypothetical protein OLMES_2682 [Oleiphilus messinensis]MCG8610672.1 hypothetical protein [Pseudomonadales bacterium]